MVESGCHFGEGNVLNRNFAVDILKVSMAFMIVGLHSGFLNDVTALGCYLTVNGIFRIAVPLFLLINGFYFYPVLSKEKSVYWIKRVLTLYLFWMLFYSFFWFRLSEISFVEIAKIARKLIFGYFHLWYLPGMLGAAVLVILLKKQKPRLMMSTILFTFAVGVVIQYAGNYHLVENQLIDKLSNSDWVYNNFFFFSFPFFCTGFVINKLSIHKKISFKFSVGLSIIGFSLLTIESYCNYIDPSADGGFSSLFSLLVVCPSVFLLCMNLNFKGKTKLLTLYSSGVYFIHPFFLHIYSRNSDFEGTGLTFVVIMSSIFASYFLIKINKRVKVIL